MLSKRTPSFAYQQGHLYVEAGTGIRASLGKECMQYLLQHIALSDWLDMCSSLGDGDGVVEFDTWTNQRRYWIITLSGTSDHKIWYSIVDLTNLKQREEAMSRIMDSIDEVAVDWELATGKGFENNASRLYHGRQVGDPVMFDVEHGRAAYHPDHFQRVNDVMLHMLANPTVKMEEELLVKDQRNGGNYTWISMRVRVSRFDEQNRPTHVSGVLIDISAMKASEEALQQNKDRLQRIVNHIPVPLFETTPRFEMLWCNKAYEDFVGFSFDQLKGHGWKDHMQLHGFASHDDAIIDFQETIKNKSVYRTLYPYPQKDGSSRWGSVITTETTEDRSSYLGYITDVTEHVEREQELEEANSQLNEVVKQLDSASKARSLFFASVSHEIRTPLNGVIGSSLWLIETDLDEEQRESCKAIVDCSNHLLQLVSDILELSKIQSEFDSYGGLKLIETDFDFVLFMNSITRMFQVGLKEKNLTFDLHIIVGDSNELASECMITADDSRLRQIILNLISNAIKFSRDGVIKIEASITDQLSFSIEDCGIGISEEDCKRLFQPFVQASNSNTIMRHNGAGLGLSISYKFVKALGGDIQVESHLGHGTKFSFSVPVQKHKFTTTMSSAVLRQMAALQVSALPNTDLKMMLCDDNSVNLQVLTRMLKKMEFNNYVTTQSGQESLDVLEREPFDLVFMDISLPDFSGVEVLQRFRANKQYKHKPWFVACTANCMTGDREIYFKAGFDAYLGKPFRPDELKTIMTDFQKLRSPKMSPTSP